MINDKKKDQLPNSRGFLFNEWIYIPNSSNHCMGIKLDNISVGLYILIKFTSLNCTYAFVKIYQCIIVRATLRFGEPLGKEMLCPPSPLQHKTSISTFQFEAQLQSSTESSSSNFNLALQLQT